MSDNENEKKLTEKEKIRLEKFEAKAKELQEQGYTMKFLTISPLKANLGSLAVTLPFVIIYFVWYLMVVGTENLFNYNLTTMLIAILFFAVLIVVHELIHGITWKLFVKDRTAIEFGFNAAALAPYCTCSLPLKKSQYIIGALMPTLILGFALGAVAIYAGNGILFAEACFMFIGGGGDFLMVINLLKNKVDTKDILYYDHPTEIGSVVFYR